MAENPDLETWETTTHSVCSVNVYNAKGESKAKVVGGRAGQRVQLTHSEREDLNEDLVDDDSVAFCIFRNGYLRPVKNVPDEVVQRFVTETLTTGGHTVEQLIEALDGKQGAEFDAWVAGLNEATLRRLAEVAEAADAKASQVTAIDTALAKHTITGPEGSAARMTDADKIVHAEAKTGQQLTQQ